MTNDTRLLAHLTQRFAPHPEDIATDGLAFLLQQSASMRAAFWNTVKTLVPAVPETVAFRTQVTQVGGTRPDVVGFDAAGHEVAMIEAKFWAGLTPNQPVAYLERLRANGAIPSTLLVIGPMQRLESLWLELRTLCLASGNYPEWRELPSPNQAHVASVTAEISLALISWPHLLGALVAQASSDKDELMISDLLQLQSLTQQQDEDAFLPLQSFELGQEFPRRVVLFPNLVEDLVGAAQSLGLVSTEGLLRSILPTGYGRYVRVAGTGCRVGVSFEYWRRYRPTPLWLEFGWTEDTAEMRAANRVRMKPLEDESRLIALPDARLLVPLFMPLGVERAAVLAALVEQVREVYLLLFDPPEE